jgi:hypothetical protein
MRKSEKNIFFIKLNMAFGSEGCKQKEVNAIPLSNNKFKIQNITP